MADSDTVTTPINKLYTANTWSDKDRYVRMTTLAHNVDSVLWF